MQGPDWDFFLGFQSGLSLTPNHSRSAPSTGERTPVTGLTRRKTRSEAKADNQKENLP